MSRAAAAAATVVMCRADAADATIVMNRADAIPMPMSLTHDIWLVVSVPVLSEQMTVVQPRVSTDGSFLHSTRTYITMRFVERQKSHTADSHKYFTA